MSQRGKGVWLMRVKPSLVGGGGLWFHRGRGGLSGAREERFTAGEICNNCVILVYCYILGIVLK